MFDEFDLPENVKKVLMDKVRHRLMPNPVKIRAGAPEFNNPPPYVCVWVCVCVSVCTCVGMLTSSAPPPKKKKYLSTTTPLPEQRLRPSAMRMRALRL